MENLSKVQTVTIVALVLFAVLMVAIGLYSAKRARTIEGFLLGSRSIGPWMSAFAYGTSYFSAVIFVGYAGNHGWNIGFSSMWIGIGNAVLGCLLAWVLLARRTRHMTHSLNVKTMPEFFEARYSSTPMKIYAALIIFIFLVPYSAAVYKGLGSMFNVIFPGVDVRVIMLVIAVLSAIYLMLGGYVATAYTDFVQGLVMIVGVVTMVVLLLRHPMVGGLSQAFAKVQALGEADGVNSLTSLFGGDKWRFLTMNILLTSFGALGLPQMISKYYAIRDEKSIPKATIVSTAFALLVGMGAYFVGSLGRIFLNNQLPEGGFDSVVPNTLMVALGTPNLFSNIVLAVILLLLLSASMSTLSSIVLTSASAISVDLVPTIKKDIPIAVQMPLTRILCLVFVAASFVFASMDIDLIVNIMSLSWGVVSGCFIGPYVWGIYSKRVSRAGAWAGMVGGLLTVLVVNFGLHWSAPTAGVLAMLVSITIVPLVSLFTKKPSKDSVEVMFR